MVQLIITLLELINNIRKNNKNIHLHKININHLQKININHLQKIHIYIIIINKIIVLMKVNIWNKNKVKIIIIFNGLHIFIYQQIKTKQWK